MNLKNIETIFDSIAKGITSLAAVVFVMLMTTTGMVFFSHTLFNHVFPDGMADWEKFAATWLMATAWEATVLITTVNVKHINKNVPFIMALCSGIIVLFFIQAFDSNQNWLVIFQRWFVGLLAATINYIYAEMFYAKWMERLSLIEQPVKLNELHSRVNELQSELNEAHSNLNQLKGLKEFKSRIDEELTCPHCHIRQSSYGTLHAHKGHCAENPKNKKS